MQINDISKQETKFLNLEGTPQITSNNQSVKILHSCGCELNQHFLIGESGKFKTEIDRHLNIKFCKNHLN